MKNIHFLSISPKAILHLMNKTHSEKNTVCDFYKLPFIILLRELIMMEYEAETSGNMLHY